MIGIGSGDSAAYNIGASAASLAELREYALAVRSLMTDRARRVPRAALPR